MSGASERANGPLFYASTSYIFSPQFGDQSRVKPDLAKSAISCPTCNKCFADGQGNLRAAVAKKVAEGDPGFIQAHVDR